MRTAIPKIIKSYGVMGNRFTRVEFPDGTVIDVKTRGHKLTPYGTQFTPDAWGNTWGGTETRAAIIRSKAIEMKKSRS